MEQMEAKLKEYRRKKRRTEQFENLKETFRRFIMLGTGIADNNVQINMKDVLLTKEMEDNGTNAASKENPSDLPSDEDDIPKDDDVPFVKESQHESSQFLKHMLRMVYFLFWITVFVIAIELKFGTVYLMFSALIGIYLNTRTGPKKRNEISAYSVFNKNCESIDGTLKAEQFEQEIRFGAGSVK